MLSPEARKAFGDFMEAERKRREYCRRWFLRILHTAWVGWRRPILI
jgi:hypothetical protein